VEYVMLLRKYNRPTYQIVGNSDIIDLFKMYKPELLFEAGSAYKYSNTGYVLLAIIIERVSGRSFPVFLEQNIFDPLDMGNSFVYNLKMKECPHDRAMGFASDKTRTERYDLTYLDGVMGDGNVYSSADDLFKWDRALYTEKLVKKSTIALAFTPGRLNDGSTTNYGFGWIISDDGERVTHSGAWRGFRTMIHRDTAAENTLIFLDNSTNSYRSRQIRAIHNLLKGKKHPRQ
jgi:CubicO group peptidase (beta-lactamase class C family)